MFENKKLGDVHYSRVIASWRNVYPGKVWYEESFKDWLRDLGATEEQVRDICELANCGKFELERDAERFIELERQNKRGDFEFDDEEP